ncbi:MAG: helicase-related protein [archaeon GB-1867-035]|nr:helicase-related protein [Candidatus Culexmicrobium profundum]
MPKKKTSPWWKEYLNYLDNSPQSIRSLVEKLTPKHTIQYVEKVRIKKDYKLWPFQEEILNAMLKHERSLILGLPTGLGKTFLAGAYLEKINKEDGLRVLFLVPSVPLGVQQTLFARRRLGVKNAYFISGAIPPEKRRLLNVWNAGFIVTTPQTFANDHLYAFDMMLKEARIMSKPLSYLSEILEAADFQFPFDIVVADECQRYIGETDGYSILLTAAACKVKILALSATPQLHAPHRLEELKKIFNKIEIFSIDNPSIRKYMPSRVLYITKIPTPNELLKVYRAIDIIIAEKEKEIKNKYGSNHLKVNCTSHPECRKLVAFKILKFRMIENGASSVLKYATWRIKELNKPLKELNGKSIIQLYREALKACFNHKLNVAIKILENEIYDKAIIFAEGVEIVKQIGKKLQDLYGMEKIAILVGKGHMKLEQQASALMQFKEKAKILVATQVGEEGLDIPTAEIEIWIDPPSNPRKWIQRFGRILRQPTGRKIARIYALISTQTHERNKLLSVMKKTEKVYGFTQKVVYRTLTQIEKGQKTLTSFMKKLSN